MLYKSKKGISFLYRFKYINLNKVTVKASKLLTSNDCLN